MKNASRSLLAMLFILASARATGASIIYNLGTLGGTESRGEAVNTSGQIAGSSRTNPSNTYHAFAYSGAPGNGGVMADLGTLGGSESEGHAINAAGQIAGSSRITGGGTQTNFHAFRYTGTPGAGGSMADLGTLGGFESYGTGINSSGQVTGYSLRATDLAPNYHAFIYTGTPGSGGAMADLGTLGGNRSEGHAINDSGQVAGSSLTSLGVTHAFRYSGVPGNGGGMVDLGTLGNPAGAGGRQSNGTAINASGQVAGDSDTFAGPSHAFLYTGTPGNGGVMADLGTLGGTVSSAAAINALGQVAGSSLTSANTNRAFLYTGTPGVDGHMTNLDAWLDATDPTEGAKWTLINAYGLSDNGLVTGYGNYNGGTGDPNNGNKAFLLDASALLVPEPASVVLLAIGVAWLVWLRRRIGDWSGRLKAAIRVWD